ncbi:MAG TPA: deoxyguanosinetriphosphate triphosphohydrolase [Candidatus Hydrogenedentes bacterium]|nr:deoxyguanosinetriphosphate triphosphohydrolase [Candidatus Hydrogenedentota bacterium]HPG69022.1 deoxyguanosinetriphosphate triphosphohydrolase [Candidatus Hydrogenedentota bacterium]
MGTTVREQLERRERETLSPYAARAAETRGRARPEVEHDYRTAYQRDRDRILHTKAFRRLKRKTQVFLAPEDDHYRTRLTHTLEAAQIARTVARALFLNEDLTEAIALGHDLGHTPFGHAGEAVLDKVFEEGFTHAEQSLRVVDRLESTRNGPGLNLTFEVRDGIRHHSKGRAMLDNAEGTPPCTLEGQVLSICDAIAYINHDIDDACRAHVITLNDLPKDALAVLGKTTSQRINSMAVALIEGSRDGTIGMTREVLDATNVLRDFLYANLYPCPALNHEIRKAKRLFREMYNYLVAHPSDEILAGDPEVSVTRRTVDFMAGMTDQYALNLYARLFFPAGWQP